MAADRARTASGLPPWAVFANGFVMGTPGPDDSGSWEIVITATDPQGLSASDTVLVTVVADNHAPDNPGHIWFPYAVVGTGYSHTLADDSGWRVQLIWE